MWVLLWVVLVVAGVAVLALLGVRLFRQGKALTRELSAASERLAGISARLADLSSPERDQGTGSRR